MYYISLSSEMNIMNLCTLDLTNHNAVTARSLGPISGAHTLLPLLPNITLQWWEKNYFSIYEL